MLFRPMLNMQRFNESAKRLMLPSFDEYELLQCIKALIRLEADFVPNDPGSFLYIRPFMIGTHNELGVKSSKSAMLIVICCLAVPYYNKNIGLVAWEDYIRVSKNGTGEFKLGANYAACIMPQIMGLDRFGCEQNLWLHSEKLVISEAGTMNIFIHIKTNNTRMNGEILITPKLDGTVLNGVYRRSIIEICNSSLLMDVREESISIFELLELIERSFVLEVFGCGTAAGLVTINKIVFRGIEYKLPVDGNLSGVLRRLFGDILDERLGRYLNWNEPIN